MAEEKKTDNRKKALFLYSSASGKANKEKHLPMIFERLEKIFELEVHKTSSMEEGVELAINGCGHFDSIIVFGGDGTLNHIATALINRPHAPTLGYLPGGTLNDGGKNFGATSIKKGLEIIEKGETSSFDVIKVGDAICTYLAGFGAYMDVSYKAKRKNKKRLGHFVYYLICIKEMFAIRSYKVKITGDQNYEGKIGILSALNGKWIGGMKTNAKGKPNDGKLELLLVRPQLFNGFPSFFLHAGFIRLSGKKFHIEVDKPVEWCVDGELGPIGGQDIELLEHCLKVYYDPSIL